MPGPGEYRPDPTEGITRIGDLPKPKIRCQSRNYGRRPCPRCGHSAYRDRQVRRTLRDLGNRLTGRPYDLILIYSQGSSEDTIPNWAWFKSWVFQVTVRTVPMPRRYRPHASTVEVLSVVGPMAGSGTLVAVKAQYV